MERVDMHVRCGDGQPVRDDGAGRDRS
jgi:hypothetical protein